MPEDSETPTPPLSPRGLLERLFNPGERDEKNVQATRSVDSSPRNSARVLPQSHTESPRSVTGASPRITLFPNLFNGGGEEALIDGYLAALAAARGVAAVELAPYPRELALRHFRLATCDYGRFIMGRFWAAATPERFAAAAASPNVVLANRDLASALRFVERIALRCADRSKFRCSYC